MAHPSRIDARALSRGALAELRRLALGLGSEMQQKDIARICGVSRPTVSRWLQRYIIAQADQRHASLKINQKIRGNGLSFGQELRLREIVVGADGQMRLDFARWSRKDVQIAARRAFGVEIDHHLAGRLLQQWGVEPKPPTAAEAEAAVLRHLEEQAEWQRPAQIAVAVGCSQQYLNPILARMAEAGACDIKTVEEKVEKGRVRIRTLYRAKRADVSAGLAALFGMKPVEVIGGRVVRGRAMRD